MGVRHPCFVRPAGLARLVDGRINHAKCGFAADRLNDQARDVRAADHAEDGGFLRQGTLLVARVVVEKAGADDGPFQSGIDQVAFGFFFLQQHCTQRL